MSPLVEQALMTLTTRINVATGIDHYSDESAAKELFKLLYECGEKLSGAEISAWAAARYWKPRHAEKLGAVAEHIGQGGRVVIRDKGRWPEDIIERLRERVGTPRLPASALRTWALPVAES